MDTLDIPAGSRLKLLKATPHKEHHGKDMVQAISLRLEWWPLDNIALNQVADGLQDSLLYNPEDLGQMSAEGIPSVKKHRRCPDLHMPLKVPKREFSGYSMEIEHGIDESSALALYSLKLSKFEVEVAEGGVAVIRWSANSSREITPQLAGELCALEGTEIVITKLSPPDTTEAIDGTGAQFNKDHPLFDQASHVCPECGSDDTEEDADGGRGCNQCFHLWKPQSAADAFAANEAAGLNKDASEVPDAPKSRSNRPSLAVHDNDNEDEEQD